jgi:hypothetical protein
MAYQALIALGWKNFDAKLILENQGVLTHKSRPNGEPTFYSSKV